jgi:hypothetical protein
MTDRKVSFNQRRSQTIQQNRIGSIAGTVNTNMARRQQEKNGKQNLVFAKAMS